MRKVARNAEYTKEYNRKLVLSMLRRQSMSRAELARRIGLTRAGISLIINDLIKDEIVYELNPTLNNHGRTPTPLFLTSKAGYAIGIYLNRDGCVAGLVDMNGNLYVQKQVQLDKVDDQLEPLYQAIVTILQQQNIPMNRFCGIGISAPGPLDVKSGTILNPPRFDLWHQIPIVTILKKRLELPIYLENNATCFASYQKECVNSHNFLLLLVDSGIGSGIVLDGNVLKGMHNYTGELGHTSIQANGRKCACGNLGCLEEYASIPNLLRHTSYKTWKEVIDHVKTDQEASQILKKEANYLSVAIINLINLIHIDTVFLAGDLLYKPEIIASQIEKMVNRRILYRENQRIRILPAAKKEGSKILSAAGVAFDQTLLI